MTPVVIDASAAVEIATDSAYGRRLKALLPPGARLWAPEHIYAEAMSALRRLSVIQAKLPDAKARLALDKLLALPITRVNIRLLMPEAWELRHNVSSGDALYVVVAQHLNGPLLTADQRLASAPNLPVRVLHAVRPAI